MTQRWEVGLRCDAGRRSGVGHLVRCLALAEELTVRGVRVCLLGDVEGMPWALAQVVSHDLSIFPVPSAPSALAALVAGMGLNAVVLDGYHLDPGTGTALRSLRIRVLAIVDGEFGAGQEADVYLDQNLGATPPVIAGRLGSTALCGLGFSLLRNVVLERRAVVRRRPSLGARGGGGAARVLAVFGGTDAYDAAPTVVPLLLATGRPVHVTAVAANMVTAGFLERLEPGAGQEVEVIEPADDLPSLAAQVDLVVSASGSSVWEFFSMGLPVALVCVAANQEAAYHRVVDARLAAPLGALSQLRDDPAVRAAALTELTRLLEDGSARRLLAEAGVAVVDGEGRRRVVDAFLGVEPSPAGRGAA